MTKHILALALTLATAAPALAARVAVVDSGTDFAHEKLAGTELMNTRETAANRVDDDLNQKVDDMIGWNFIENYGKIFFRDHLSWFNPIVYPLFTVVAHKQAGVVTAEEDKFWKENVDSLPEAEKTELKAHLNAYGQYAHGTHVAGLIKSQAPNAKIMALRVFPDQMPDEYDSEETTPYSTKKKRTWTRLAYMILAAAQNGMFQQVSTYMNEQKIDVANYSLGVPLSMIAKALLGVKGIKNPTPAQLQAETQLAYSKFEKYGIKWMTASPNTLFVVAAGNDGTNNDLLPTFPANVRMPNAITVAASLDYVGLANFSCFGAKSVDIAAPGVAMVSTVPSSDRKMMLPMSGTSMATPYLAGVAAHLKDINPKLDPLGMKAILMGTVDKKDWLKGRVVSGGVVNPARAAAAATASLTMPIAAAIESARMVADVVPVGKVNPEAARGGKLDEKSAEHLKDDSLSAIAESAIF